MGKGRASAGTLWRRDAPAGIRRTPAVPCRVPVSGTAEPALRCHFRSVPAAFAPPLFRILFLPLLLPVPHRAFCQDVRENFVRCDTCLDSLGRHNTVSVQWFDGLGRPTVSATDGLSADGTVARGLREHDALGRTVREWLPGTDGRGGVLEHRGADAMWGGDISGTVDEYAQAPAEKGWDIPNTLTTGYRYDALGRMTESLPGDAAHSHAEKVTYDANGNITTLKRRGMYAPAYYSLVDDLVYRYDGNRLIGITDSVPYIPYVNEFGFRSGGAGDVDYEYNSDGALTRDPHKGVSVSYSRRGTPERASFDSGSFTDWEYTADGVRLGTWWHTAVTGARGFAAEAEEENTVETQAQPSPQTAPIYGYVENSEEFAGNYVFEDGRLSKHLFDGGYIDIASGQDTAAYRFYVRDHLGSVRVVLDDDGNVLQQLYYHPFGGVWGDAGTNVGLQPWKYSGKEYDHRDGLDLYDYGARLYDPAASRWTSPDPLCEKYYHISPYAFCNNNPIRYIDPDGRKIRIPHNQNQILSYINSLAQGVFAINKDGYLYMKKATNNQGFSKYYAEKLTGLIKDPNSTVTILVSDKVKVPNSKTGKMETKATKDYGEGVTVSLTKIYSNSKEKSHDITTTISGKSRQGLKDQSGNALEDGPAEILSHEIVGHAAPKVLGSDTGNAVENENKVRLQLNKPLRERDDDHVE